MLVKYLSHRYLLFDNFISDPDKNLLCNINHFILIHLYGLIRVLIVLAVRVSCLVPFIFSYLDTRRLFIVIRSWRLRCDIIINLRVTAVVVLIRYNFSLLIDHFRWVMLLYLIRTATLRSLLSLLSSMFDSFIKHSYKYFIFHSVNVFTSRVNIIKHPVHKMVINILIHRNNSLSHLSQLKNTRIFIIFTSKSVVKGLAMSTKLLNCLLLHLWVSNIVDTL